MATNNLYHRLEEVVKWWDWHRDTITDVVQRQRFMEKCIENQFDLLALMVVRLRDLEGKLPSTAPRPNWIPPQIPNFVERHDSEI